MNTDLLGLGSSHLITSSSSYSSHPHIHLSLILLSIAYLVLVHIIQLIFMVYIHNAFGLCLWMVLVWLVMYGLKSAFRVIDWKSWYVGLWFINLGVCVGLIGHWSYFYSTVGIYPFSIHNSSSYSSSAPRWLGICFGKVLLCACARTCARNAPTHLHIHLH